jgi:glycosyltransferase involved in cell wall biosynthesis
VAAALQGYDVYLHSASWEGAVPITAYEAMDAGLPVVIRRHPAYDSLLPKEWQFDDVAEAVRMVRVLAQEPARSRRVDEQYKLMAELRRSGPDAVLAAAYRRRLRRAWPGLGGDRDSFALDTPSAVGGGTDVEDARWVHRSSLS